MRDIPRDLWPVFIASSKRSFSLFATNVNAAVFERATIATPARSARPAIELIRLDFLSTSLWDEIEVIVSSRHTKMEADDGMQEGREAPL
jgi:hypothetical protein